MKFLVHWRHFWRVKFFYWQRGKKSCQGLDVTSWGDILERSNVQTSRLLAKMYWQKWWLFKTLVINLYFHLRPFHTLLDVLFLKYSIRDLTYWFGLVIFTMKEYSLQDYSLQKSTYYKEFSLWKCTRYKSIYLLWKSTWYTLRVLAMKEYLLLKSTYYKRVLVMAEYLFLNYLSGFLYSLSDWLSTLHV